MILPPNTTFKFYFLETENKIRKQQKKKVIFMCHVDDDAEIIYNEIKYVIKLYICLILFKQESASEIMIYK